MGSTGIGRKVLASAAENLTPVVLELGGKDPIVVCDDANLDQLVPISLRATFQSCGQNCTGAERILLQDGIYDAYVDKVVPVVKQMRQGAPLGQANVFDCGAMCMPQQAEKVQALVNDAIKKGAKLLAGRTCPGNQGNENSGGLTLVNNQVENLGAVPVSFTLQRSLRASQAPCAFGTRRCSGLSCASSGSVVTRRLLIW